MVNLEAFGAGDGSLRAFVREENEQRGKPWKTAAHMDFTLGSLARSLLLKMLCSYLCRSQLAFCSQCSSEAQCKKVDGPLANKRTRKLLKGSRAS